MDLFKELARFPIRRRLLSKNHRSVAQATPEPLLTMLLQIPTLFLLGTIPARYPSTRPEMLTLIQAITVLVVALALARRHMSLRTALTSRSPAGISIWRAAQPLRVTTC